MPLSPPKPQSASKRSAPAFTRIPLTAFRSSPIVGVDLYCASKDDKKPTLYCSSKREVTEKDIQGLESRGHKAVYVRSYDYQNLVSQLAESLDDILADESLNHETRFTVLQLAVSVEVESAFQQINNNKIISLANDIGEQITALLSNNNVLPNKLFEMVRHDYYTFTHMTNVAGFAVLLAEQLGITDPEELERIATGALLHDVGKRFIHSQVLCKPGRLTEKEMALIRTHPQRGYEDLCEREDLDFGQLMMVYQHHEHIDGGGYPVGILGDEMHLWAKLLSIVDVFDAITSNRPYRSPMSQNDALSVLQQGAGSQFDPEMVRCWNSAILQR